MRGKICVWALAAAMAVGALPGSAQAQSDDWEVVLAPYLLFGSLTGSATAAIGAPTPIDLSFSDLVKSLELGAMVHAEFFKGNWGLVTDVIFMRLGQDVDVLDASVLDIEVNEVVAEALVSRRFRGPNHQVDLLFGMRYWSLDLDLELVDTPVALDLGDSWIDPVVGARIVRDLGEDWYFTARADAGGFGVGSDFSWNAQGGIGYEISEMFSIVAQYKALDVDYQNDELALDFLAYDTTTHGPVIGFVFRF